MHSPVSTTLNNLASLTVQMQKVLEYQDSKGHQIYVVLLTIQHQYEQGALPPSSYTYRYYISS